MIDDFIEVFFGILQEAIAPLLRPLRSATWEARVTQSA